MLVLVLIEVLCVLYLVIPGYRAYQIMHPPRLPLSVTPHDMGLDYQDVIFSTADDVNLTGWYIPSRNRAGIIAIHGGDGNRTHMLYHAEVLALEGYGVLLFDLRAHGESGGKYYIAGNASLDVQAAVDYLLSRPEIDAQRIGGVGLSMGGTVLIQGAALTPSLRAVVSDGAEGCTLDDYLSPMPPEYRKLWFMIPNVWMIDRYLELLSGVQATPIKELVQQISPRPILFISTGEGTEQFMNRQFYEHAGPTAQLWELPQTQHTDGLFAYPEEYQERMLSFFNMHLMQIGVVQ
jgi:pimeloyl-ACP methyl ester carboxylesterase